MGETAAGAAAVVLAIIGLAGALPGYMASIATIAIGVAFLAKGSAIASRWSSFAREVAEETTVELESGMSAELLGGAAGVILGVLALLGVVPALLLPVALIVFGGTLLMSATTEADFGPIGGTPGAESRGARVMREASAASSGTHLLVAIAALVIGIVALVGPAKLTVTLIGLLVVGGSILLTGAAVGGRMVSMMRR